MEKSNLIQKLSNKITKIDEASKRTAGFYPMGISGTIKTLGSIGLLVGGLTIIGGTVGVGGSYLYSAYKTGTFNFSRQNEILRERRIQIDRNKTIERYFQNTDKDWVE